LPWSSISCFHLGKSTHSQNDTFDKAIGRHNQLRPDHGFLMCCRPHLPIPLFYVRNHQTKTSSPPELEPQIFTSTLILPSMPFSVTNFYHGTKTCPMMATVRNASYRSLWNQMVRKTWLRAIKTHLIRQSGMSSIWSSSAETFGTWHSGQINEDRRQADLCHSMGGILGLPHLFFDADE
jgi:hypothetical protein